MRMIYKIDVDCAICAGNMEEAANKVTGIRKATVNFMLLKMIVDFEEDVTDTRAVMKNVLKACRKVAFGCDIVIR